MAHVFISYSSKDEAQALAIVNMLESQDIHCWIACRDLPIGSNFSHAIPDAIRESPIFLLLLTSNSVTSIDVLNELTLASRYRNRPNRLILPLQLEDAYIPSSFDYHLATVQIHPFSFNEDLCRIELIGTIRKHLSPRTDMDALWGSTMEIFRTQLLNEMAQNMDNEDPDTTIFMNGFMDYIRTAPPKDFIELMCELTESALTSDEAALEQYKQEVIQALSENQGKLPAEYADKLPSIANFLENASAEETSWFHHGFMLGISAADLDPDDIIE